MKQATVKCIPLEAIMARLGHTPQKVVGDTLWYRSPIRTESNASFNISRRKNLWYDFGAGKGGSAIDLLIEIDRLADVKMACRRIEELMAQPPASPVAIPKKKTQSKTVITRVTPVESPALRAYLKKRGIDQSVAEHYLQQVHYRVGEKSYYALGFQNDSGGYELRNPYFKGSTSKDITTITGNRSRIFCFEGFMDFLTAMTMFDGTLPGTALVLNSTGLVDKAIGQIRRINPLLVDLYRDDDAGGIALLAAFQHQLPDMTVVDWAKLYAGHNDLNEWALASGVLRKCKRSISLCCGISCHTRQDPSSTCRSR